MRLIDADKYIDYLGIEDRDIYCMESVEDYISEHGTEQPEPCEDAVSRQIVIYTICDELDKIDYVPQWVYDRLEKALKQLPLVIPKQRTGKWMPENRTIDAFWACSVCGFPSEAHGANILYKFCPNCGADMRGEQDG